MTATTDEMAPNASPGAISKRSGVRRVNNLPMYLLGGVMALFLIVMGLVAADRVARQHARADRPEAKEKAGNTSMYAKEIAGDRTAGIIAPAKALDVPDMPAGLTPAASEPVPIAKPNLDAPPAPPRGENLKQPARDEEANRIRMAKFQMFEEAVKAKTAVQMVAPRSSGSANPSTLPTRDEMLARLAAVREEIASAQREDPTAAYQARLAQIRETGVGGSGGGTAASPTGSQLVQAGATAGSRNTIAQFDRVGGGDRWKLGSQVEPPRSPFELRAGFVVPATLISGINSDLPGQIMAQVAQDVFDTPTGKYLLIPQGARLVGSYSSDVAYGQARVLVAWQRIVFPDGKALDVGAMPGADGAGYAGFNDQVNNHYFRLFGSALLMSAVTAGVSYSQRNEYNKNGPPNAASTMSEALGQQLGQVTTELLRRNMNIAPTLEIRPGYRFNVVVIEDMTFSKPYRAFDY
jgi:type IV secretory pathway VirB10-like protein